MNEQPAESSTARRDRLIGRAADALGPDRSLVRIETAGRAVFTNAALVGALLTGFGLVDPETVKEQPELSTLAIGLVVASLLGAAWALVGKVAEIDVDNPDEVAANYDAVVGGRGLAVMLASISFALALPTAGLAAVLAMSTDGSAPRTKVTGALTLEPTPHVTASQDLGKPGAGTTAEVTVTADGRRMSLGRFAAQSDGRLKWSLEARVPQGTAEVKIRSVQRGGEHDGEVSEAVLSR